MDNIVSPYAVVAAAARAGRVRWRRASGSVNCLVDSAYEAKIAFRHAAAGYRRAMNIFGGRRYRGAAPICRKTLHIAFTPPAAIAEASDSVVLLSDGMDVAWYIGPGTACSSDGALCRGLG